MSKSWKAPQKCVTCTDPTKTRVEACGPDTGMKLDVYYVCDNEECDVKQSEKLIEEIKKQAAEPKPKKAAAKKPTAKKAGAKKK